MLHCFDLITVQHIILAQIISHPILCRLINFDNSFIRILVIESIIYIKYQNFYCIRFHTYCLIAYALFGEKELDVFEKEFVELLLPYVLSALFLVIAELCCFITSAQNIAKYFKVFAQRKLFPRLQLSLSIQYKHGISKHVSVHFKFEEFKMIFKVK